MNRGETWTDGQCLGFLREHYKCDRVGEYIETLVSDRKDFERLKELCLTLRTNWSEKVLNEISSMCEESEATDERKG